MLAAIRRASSLPGSLAAVPTGQEIGKPASFSAWCKIGRALSIGKAHALKVTGANAAGGQHYSREFGGWMKAHGFGSMSKATRSWAVALHENAASIEQWRLRFARAATQAAW
jgi:hypothetical protein